MRALRRENVPADQFPTDVVTLQTFLGTDSLVPGVRASPGAGSNVPLYILGSPMYGAHLAASLGLPYAFASHFAPRLLNDAIAAYRTEFQPSAQLERPYVMAGINIVAAETKEAAKHIAEQNRRDSTRQIVGRGKPVFDDDLNLALSQGAGRQFDSMFRYTTVGNSADVAIQLTRFQELSEGRAFRSRDSKVTVSLHLAHLGVYQLIRLPNLQERRHRMR